MYRLDGQLVAMAVLDILPNCVSSVYFMYDIAWERFSFGKVASSSTSGDMTRISSI
jgi:arginine-tRNA-protein transferase